MLTVPEPARRAGRGPETVRRWIRGGKLRPRTVGTQHVIEEEDLVALLGNADEQLLPEEWSRLPDGRPMPNFVRYIRERRGPVAISSAPAVRGGDAWRVADAFGWLRPMTPSTSRSRSFSGASSSPPTHGSGGRRGGSASSLGSTSSKKRGVRGAD